MKRLLVILLFCILYTSIVTAEAPKKTLYLQCGSHLIAIGTTLDDKYSNFAQKSDCEFISYDHRILRKNQEINDPIDISMYGSACKDRFNLSRDYTYEDNLYYVDRITGKLVWNIRVKDREDDFFDRGTIVNKGKYECTKKTKAQIKNIIKNHNDKVRRNKPERKF